MRTDRPRVSVSWAAKVGVAIVVIAGTALTGPASATAPSRPGAPTITSVVPGERTLLVGFEAPADDGGFGIVDYQTTCTPVAGGTPGTQHRDISPILVTKLTGGKHYTCRVRAQGGGGYGPFSAPSEVVVPVKEPAKVPPDPPSAVHAQSEVAAVEVRFNLVRSGGQAVTGYRALCTATDGTHHNTQRRGRSPILVDHLLEAKAYTCQVETRNPSGWSAYSKSSNEVVTKTTRPGAPVIKSVTAGVHRLQVAYARPANPGGTAISSYRATCTSSDGGLSGAQRGLRSPLTVTNLSAKTYRCRLTAANSYGTGPPSALSPPVVVRVS